MTHVFIFNNGSRAANYGIGTYVRQVSDGLTALPGYVVSFVEMNTNTQEFVVAKDDSGRFHYQIPATQSGMEDENYCRIIFYFLARNIESSISTGKSQIRDEDCHIVFQFNYFQHLPLAILLKGHFPKSRIILTVHYFSWCFDLRGNLSRMREITAKGHTPIDDIEKRVVGSFQNEQMFMHLADEVFVMSKETKNIVLVDYCVKKDKVHLIYNGHNNELATNETFPTRDILFVGRLDEIKGLKYLIDAFISISSKHISTNLIIAGDGDFQPYLAQCRCVPNRVVFVGKLQTEEVEQCYNSAYIGVMPSFHEQCSYTAIEMMRHGIPLIGTDSTGLREMLDNTPELLVRINEKEFDENAFTEQIARRIDLLLSDENAHRKASRAFKELYIERYRISDMTDGIRRALQYSFQREGYIVSSDYMKYMDNRMMQLVNLHPDIDCDIIGLSGIGIYLWWRINQLADTTESFQRTILEEYLIYYLDWLCEVSVNEKLPTEIIFSLLSMESRGFYKTKVREILSMQTYLEYSSNTTCSGVQIIQNALRICNYKI